MKSGILREDEGFDLYINGRYCSFRDAKKNAYAAARYAKSMNRGQDKVEIVDRSTNSRFEILADGRTA